MLKAVILFISYTDCFQTHVMNTFSCTTTSVPSKTFYFFNGTVILWSLNNEVLEVPSRDMEERAEHRWDQKGFFTDLNKIEWHIFYMDSWIHNEDKWEFMYMKNWQMRVNIALTVRWCIKFKITLKPI